MLRISFSALIGLFLILGCASSGMTEAQRSKIPDGANSVVVHSQEPASDLYKSAYRLLRKRGFRMAESNQEMNSLSTDGRSTGESRTMMRIDVFVENNGSGSTLTANADARITQFGWYDASNASPSAKVTLAFEELVLLMQELPHQSIEYRSK